MPNVFSEGRLLSKRYVVLFLVLAVVATITAAWIIVAQNASEMKIGAISPFTGDGAEYGESARTGIDLALDEINAAGGVNGAKLSVRYEDDRGDQGTAVSAFNKLVSIDKVPAVLGPFYSGNVLQLRRSPTALRRS